MSLASGAPFLTVAIVSIVALAASCTAAPATPSSPPASEASGLVRPSAPEGELPDELQARLQEALDATMTEYGVPGAAVGVWIPEAGAWTSATGLADTANNVPVTLEMTWPLRSVTKSYTVTVLLQLVDEGVMSLDDAIGDYVDGVTDGDRITLRQLAEMSSGNADYTGDVFLADFVADPERIFTLDELNGFMLGEPPQFAPGTEKVYTNANTNLLGAAIENVTGEAFSDVLGERILAPLGQTRTRYIVDATKWDDPHARGYSPDADALEVQPDNLSIFGPAGSMITSIDDARVWAATLATGSLLQPATQAQRLQGAPLDAGPPYDSYALGIGETEGWWGHNGEGLGFTAAVFHQPESGTSVVVFMNTSNLASRAHPADQMFRRIAHILTTGSER